MVSTFVPLQWPVLGAVSAALLLQAHAQTVSISASISVEGTASRCIKETDRALIGTGNACGWTGDCGAGCDSKCVLYVEGFLHGAQTPEGGASILRCTSIASLINGFNSRGIGETSSTSDLSSEDADAVMTCPTPDQIRFSSEANLLPKIAQAAEEADFYDKTVVELLNDEAALQKFVATECSSEVVTGDAAGYFSQFVNLESVPTPFQICRDSMGLLEEDMQKSEEAYELCDSRFDSGLFPDGAECTDNAMLDTKCNKAPGGFFRNFSPKHAAAIYTPYQSIHAACYAISGQEECISHSMPEVEEYIVAYGRALNASYWTSSRDKDATRYSLQAGPTPAAEPLTSSEGGSSPEDSSDSTPESSEMKSLTLFSGCYGRVRSMVLPFMVVACSAIVSCIV